MINANEIRLGNWVKVTFDETEVGYGKDYFAQIIAIQERKVLVKGDQHWHPIDKIDAIPLTPEILEKCGCIQGHDKDMWKNSIGVWITRAANGKFFVTGMRAGYYIEYLHQYQNICYFMTGEELTINI